MPAVQAQSNGESDEAPSEETPSEGAPTVHDYLEMALQTAGEQEMSTSELMGIFFYYAHSIAESYRQDVLAEHESQQL